MPLTTPQLEEIAGLAQRGRMGFLNDLADRWGVQYLEVARSYADAQRALKSPPGTRPPSPPAAPAPAAETPQEVQIEMPRGTPNPAYPGDEEIIRLIAELKEQRVKNVTKALAAKLSVPHGTARNWHYKAQGSSPTSPNPPASGFACETCRDSGYVGGGNAGVACECPIGRRIAGQVQATLAEPAAGAPVLGNVPLVDDPAPGEKEPEDMATLTARLKVELREKAALRTDIPTVEQIEAFANGFALSAEPGRAASPTLDTGAYTQRIADLEAEARDLRSQLVTVRADHGQLLAENEQLQADLKAAVQTIEQAAPGCVIYQLFGDDLSGRPDVLTMAPGEALSRGDEWPQVIRSAGGPRRVYVWHCVDTITLSGGNVVCTLLPGAAKTLEGVA